MTTTDKMRKANITHLTNALEELYKVDWHNLEDDETRPWLARAREAVDGLLRNERWVLEQKGKQPPAD